MDLQDGVWAGEPACLVGGGPSLRSFDFRLLRRAHNKIVVNASYKDVPDADILFSEDLDFVRLVHQRDDYKAFAGMRLYACLDPNFESEFKRLDPKCTLLTKGSDDKYWSKSLADGLSRSSNSMIGALNLADILGADPIMLLGVDCNPIEGGNPNYHDLYTENMKSGNAQMESFKSDFELWAALHLKNKRVLNLNPNSAVTCWPKIRPEEVLL